MLEDPIVDLIYDILCATTPLASIFWMYLIIFQSPAEMRHFKWLLLKLAITEEIFVCSLTTLLKPDLLFPAEGGAMRGIAARWGGQLGVNIAVRFSVSLTNLDIFKTKDKDLSAAIGFASGGGAMLGVSDCAHMRALMIYQRDDLVEKLFKKGYVLIYVFIFHISLTYVLMFYLVFWAAEDSQTFVARMDSFGYHTYIAFYVEQNATFFSFDTSKTSSYVLVGVSCFYSIGGLMTVYLENMTSVYFMMRKLRQLRTIMSKVTWRNHVGVVRMIWTQSTYPLLMWLIPIWVVMVSMLFRWPEIVANSIFKHYFCLSIMYYPTLSFILSVVCLRPYRVFILEKIFRRKVSPEPTVEHSVESHPSVQPQRVNLNEADISEYIAP